MSPREIIYTVFYAIGFFLAMVAGAKTGFTGTHTPPMPFAVELLVLPLGLVFLLIDFARHQTTRVHKIGLSVNGLIMFIVVMLAFMHF